MVSLCIISSFTANRNGTGVIRVCELPMGSFTGTADLYESSVFERVEKFTYFLRQLLFLNLLASLTLASAAAQSAASEASGTLGGRLKAFVGALDLPESSVPHQDYLTFMMGWHHP